MTYNDNVSYDTEFHRRLELLADLMEVSPRKKMKKLQWEALKYYPLHYYVGIRLWMTWHVAFMAADILNKRQGLYD